MFCFVFCLQMKKELSSRPGDRDASGTIRRLSRGPSVCTVGNKRGRGIGTSFQIFFHEILHVLMRNGRFSEYESMCSHEKAVLDWKFSDFHFYSPQIDHFSSKRAKSHGIIFGIMYLFEFSRDIQIPGRESFFFRLTRVHRELHPSKCTDFTGRVFLQYNMTIRGKDACSEIGFGRQLKAP